MEQRTRKIITTQKVLESLRPGKWNAQTSLGFLDENRSPNPSKTTRTCDNQEKNNNKKLRTCRIVDFADPVDQRKNSKKVKKEINTLTLLENWKSMEHECDDDIKCHWCAWYSHQKISTGTGGLRNKRTTWEHPNYCIIKISNNTAKIFCHSNSV